MKEMNLSARAHDRTLKDRALVAANFVQLATPLAAQAQLHVVNSTNPAKALPSSPRLTRTK